MKRAILRRSATVVAGATAIALVGAGVAMADVSPTNVTSSSTTLYWSGQGAPVSQKCGSSADSGGVGFINGSSPNSYEVWIFSTDGGAVNTPPAPTLTVNGTVYTGAVQTSSTGSDWHIITPYIDPNTITPANPKIQNSTGSAFTSFTVQNPGTGNWKLVISHGCAGPGQANSPTVTKNAAGAYDTNWAWTVKKSASPQQANAPPGQPVKVTYTVTVNGQATNKHIVVNGTITITNPNNAAIPNYSATDQLSPNLGTCDLSAEPSVLQPGPNQFPYTCSNIPDNSNLNGVTNTVTVSWPQQTLLGGAVLAASGSNPATFTTPPIVFTQGTVTDKCVHVTDSVAGNQPDVCASQLDGNGNYTFTYQETYNDANGPSGADPAGTCTNHLNVVTITGADSGTQSSDHATVQICTGAPLTVTKNATPAFSRDIPWNITKNVDKSKQVVPVGGSGAAFNYTVDVTHGTPVDSGWVVTGQITVSNPNDWESVKLTNLSDAIDNGGTCTVDGSPGLTIPAASGGQDGSQTYNYKCTYENGAPSPLLGHNTATATWDAGTAFTVGNMASGEADADFGSVNPTITNGTIHVKDSLAGDLGDASYTDTNPIEFTYKLVFNNDPSGTCTDHNNVASFTGDNGASGSANQTVTVCVADDLTVTKTATPTLTQKFHWNVSKSVDNLIQTGPQPGVFNYAVSVTHDGGVLGTWNVGGTITVSNPNDFEDISINPLSDVIQNLPGNVADSNANCGGLPAGNTNIPAGQSVTFPYDCTYQPGGPGSDHQVNVATATWDQSAANTPSGSASGSSNDWLWSAQTPTKIDDSVNVFDTVDGGAPVQIGTVHSTDPSPTVIPINNVTYPNDPPGTCTQHSDQASVTGDTLGINTPSNTVTVKDCVVAPLIASKTANASFNRTYPWSIQKQETPPLINPGGTASYTVTVTQAKPVDGNFLVAGNLTVNNPNDFEAITLGTVVDNVSDGGKCTFASNPSGASIAAGTTVVYPYTCSYSSNPAEGTQETNTVTIPWTANGSSGTAKPQASFSFVNPQLINHTITPTDSFNGGAPVNLCVLDPSQPCTLTGSDTGPFPVITTYHYTRTPPPPTSGCQPFPNTATTGLTGNGQTSGATVTECSLGGLTMGFWHNMNGQKIITNSSGVGTWLYSNFGGASGPYASLNGATGAKVATAFQNAFGAANCSGNCTPMLLAQSFATALNVYFSGGAPGVNAGGSSNQIGAFNGNGTHQVPIGTAIVNLTPYSPPFPSAHMTVFAALQYVNSQYSAGVFFGGNPSPTGLAASAFAAINQDTIALG